MIFTLQIPIDDLAIELKAGGFSHEHEVFRNAFTKIRQFRPPFSQAMIVNHFLRLGLHELTFLDYLVKRQVWIEIYYALIRASQAYIPMFLLSHHAIVQHPLATRHK